MKYLQGILFGAVVSVVAGIVYVIITLIIVFQRTPRGVEVGFDLRSIFSRPSLWTIAFWLTVVAGFALGFWSAFRRAR
jgi:hypothetical protein